MAKRTLATKIGDSILAELAAKALREGYPADDTNIAIGMMLGIIDHLGDVGMSDSEIMAMIAEHLDDQEVM